MLLQRKEQLQGERLVDGVVAHGLTDEVVGDGPDPEPVPLEDLAAPGDVVVLGQRPVSQDAQGDAQQLRQVVHNLLQNAQDATEGQAHPRVLIATQWVPTSGRVRLVVRDNGPGFPPKILNRAFEPYVTTKSRGTGLGLAVVKKIADEHSARVDLKNRGLHGRVIGAQVSLSFQVAESQQNQLI